MTSLKHKTNRLVIPLTVMIVIVILSVISVGAIKEALVERFPDLPTWKVKLQRQYDVSLEFSSIQNFLHIPFFALLSFAWMWFFGKKKIGFVAASLYTTGIVICFSLFDEFLQLFFPGREASLWDLMFNLGGCLLGILAYRVRRVTK